MKIQQFEDKSLSHYSYAIISESVKEIVLIDPARDASPYYAFAEKNAAKIIAVIETHPHADFISSHLEIHQTTGATIYCSKLLAGDYPHELFDDGDSIKFGDLKLKAMNTPGHSPDSISVVLEQAGKDYAVFTGDTLFIGDCGRPDLRESAGNITAKRDELALQMYHSLREKLMVLNDDVVVYPAHGAGTLCGKSLSNASSSTIGAEKESNWSLQPTTVEAFVKTLTEDQPFVPNYFPFDVELNKKGAHNLKSALDKVIIHDINNEEIDIKSNQITIIDTRPSEEFKAGHLPNSFNIMLEGKFETWLGSILTVNEPFYLVAQNISTLMESINKVAKIGYEGFIKQAFVVDSGSRVSPKLNLEEFKANPEMYTIIDVRNESEVQEQKAFSHAISIPLPELRKRVQEVPTTKPIVVHCAGGYRSAAGSSILANALPAAIVYDLGDAVKMFLDHD
jgi:glyoxylase-like metal-dependent hydrolase (beta-lactamase superfamily II)/rhodanese-related sulfurtransferase